MALDDEKPENEETTSKVEQEQDTPKTPDKRLVIVLGVAFALLIAAMVYFMFFFNNGPKEEPAQPQETETSQPVPSQQPTNPPSDETTQPTTPPTNDPTSQAEMEKAGKEFVEKFGAKSSPTDMAKSLEAVTSTALNETLKVTDPKSLPEKGTVKFSGNKGTVTNDKGALLYSFTMKQIKDQWVVDSVNLPEVKETQYDKKGFPIPPPIPPFSSYDYDNFYNKAIGVSKTYFEYNAGDSMDARKEQMKKAVHGGSFPDPKDYGLGTEGQARTYAPEHIQILDARTTSGLKPNTISVYMEVSVTDLALKDKAVIDKQKIVVEFSWNKTTQMWEASSLKTV